MLPPPGAIAAGGLYTATEFDVTGLDALRPSLVEMGRAVVRDDHRNGGVVLLMWAGILAYLDRCGYDYVTRLCLGARRGSGRAPPGSQIRGVRDFVLRRHAAPAEYTVYPYRPVTLDGRALDDIDPPARVAVPPLMRGYLRLGAQVCGEPAHDPDFGVGDFPALLDKRQADTRYLKRLRSVAAASDDGRRDRVVSATSGSSSPWLPRATCDAELCARRAARRPVSRSSWRVRVAVRATFAVLLLSAVPLLAIPMPGRSHIQRGYCRLMLRCLGVRITVSGGPIRNLRGVLVVSGHVSWVDIFAIGAVHAGLVRRQGRADQLARPRDRRPG